MQLSVPSHTTYLAGYVDAAGRQFTDGARLCAVSANLVSIELYSKSPFTIRGPLGVARPLIYKGAAPR